MHQEHFSAQREQEGPEKKMAWTIDGSPERAAEAVDMIIHHLEASKISEARIADLKKTFLIGIENAVTYANHGDVTKSIAIEFSVYGAENGGGSVEISIMGEDKAIELSEPTNEEADLQGARAGDLFVKLPSGVEVTLFPKENKVVLKQGGETAAE